MNTKMVTRGEAKTNKGMVLAPGTESWQHKTNRLYSKYRDYKLNNQGLCHNRGLYQLVVVRGTKLKEFAMYRQHPLWKLAPLMHVNVLSNTETIRRLVWQLLGFSVHSGYVISYTQDV